MRELIKQSANAFFGTVWEDFVRYFRVYDYLKLKTSSALGSMKDVPSIASFWYSILGDQYGSRRDANYVNISDNSPIRLRDVFLTEWAPKLPGQIWTKRGMLDFSEGKRHVGRVVRRDNNRFAVVDAASRRHILDPYGKRKVVSAGIGSIRIKRRHHDSDHFMYMALVDRYDWQCDYGIPVVVSKSVYREFQRYAKAGAPWIESIEGCLHVDDGIPLTEILPRAIGAKLSPETEESLTCRPNLRQCYLHVTSPLSVKFRFNDSHPSATAWTMFRTSRWHEAYSYTYIPFNPYSSDSIEEAIQFINWYVGEYSGTSIVTDFDGQQPRLEAEIPLTSSPLRTHKNQVARVIRDCDKWVSSTMRRLDKEY